MAHRARIGLPGRRWEAPGLAQDGRSCRTATAGPRVDRPVGDLLGGGIDRKVVDCNRFDKHNGPHETSSVKSVRPIQTSGHG